MEKKQLKYKWLYETFEKDLFSYGMAFDISTEQLQDAIHDVFLHLYEHESQIWNSPNIKFYLLTSLRNKIISQKRSAKPIETLNEEESYSFTLEVSGLELIEQEEERNETSILLQKLLNGLTDRQREAIYMRYAQGISFEEISQEMQIQPKAAQKLVYRAIESMRKSITAYLFSFF